MTSPDLESQARAFAERLTGTVRALAPRCPAFVSKSLTDDPGTQRAVVRQDPATGIPLTVDKQAILTLKVEYFCSLDSDSRWLATDEAHIKVHAGDKAADEPLFHYHYRRQGGEDLAAAHLHIYAHRDALSHVLSRTGRSTPRGKARVKTNAIPRTRDLHFPLGGHRFRPCLEDVLEMLVLELGVDHTKGALEALRVGRERWRRDQTRTVVRDAPDEVIAYLKELGYDVTLRDGRESPPGNPGRLRQL